MEDIKDLEQNIFRDDFLMTTYPEFFEKNNYLFENELKSDREYYMVGFIKENGENKSLYDTEELIVLSDDVLEFGGYYGED